jgi:hypothetical protein
MLLAESVVDLTLKLKVRAGFARAGRRSSHIHVHHIRAHFEIIGKESSPSSPCLRASADGNEKATSRE